MQPDLLLGASGQVKLLVIAPQSFAEVLQPLIAHKNDTGMPARLVTLESLRVSFPGKDDPEKVKRAIADAHERLGARYVMLVGDASLMPGRYRQVQQIPKGGDLWRNGQRKYWLNNRKSENVFRHPRIYLGIMTMFGDPSLRLPAGEVPGR